MSASSLLACLSVNMWQERLLWVKSRECVCLALACRGGMGVLGLILSAATASVNSVSVRFSGPAINFDKSHRLIEFKAIKDIPV